MKNIKIKIVNWKVTTIKHLKKNLNPLFLMHFKVTPNLLQIQRLQYYQLSKIISNRSLEIIYIYWELNNRCSEIFQIRKVR